MKTLILGDIHGRTIWKQIVEKEHPDLTIFLGDYVSSHEGISEADQILNLEQILDFKEQNSDKVILLRGNHDLEALHYAWSQCWPVFNSNYFDVPEHKERFLSDTQWVHVDGNIVYSHAGISENWFNTMMQRKGIDTIQELNELEPSHYFGFIPDGPFDSTGTSKTQSLVWIRPDTLIKHCVKDKIWVVGHTQAHHIVNLRDFQEVKVDVWLCDCLAQGEYLINEDGVFKPSKL